MQERPTDPGLVAQISYMSQRVYALAGRGDGLPGHIAPFPCRFPPRLGGSHRIELPKGFFLSPRGTRGSLQGVAAIRASVAASALVSSSQEFVPVIAEREAC